MRLIDADKLYKVLAKPSDLPGDTIDVMEVRLAILAAPEVEAIPVEFIEDWSAKLYFGNSDMVCDKLIKQWRDLDAVRGKQKR